MSRTRMGWVGRLVGSGYRGAIGALGKPAVTMTVEITTKAQDGRRVDVAMTADEARNLIESLSAALDRVEGRSLAGRVDPPGMVRLPRDTSDEITLMMTRHEAERFITDMDLNGLPSLTTADETDSVLRRLRDAWRAKVSETRALTLKNRPSIEPPKDAKPQSKGPRYVVEPVRLGFAVVDTSTGKPEARMGSRYAANDMASRLNAEKPAS